MTSHPKLLYVILLLSLLLPLGAPVGAAPASRPSADLAETILQSMLPEEIIGQLMLVTFEGDSLKGDEPIFTLIKDYHVGGVMLSSRRSNLSDGSEGLIKAQQLINALQSAEFEASRQASILDPTRNLLVAPVYVPLLIGINAERLDPLYNTLPEPFSDVPSQMAIGAAWDPQLAGQAGELLGRELQSIGINLLLGPSLDTLGDPQLGGSFLGVEAFGGSSYWVSVLGKSYVEGLHRGADGELAVIASHFPGVGYSGRPLGQEIVTIRKTLEQLQTTDLAPFFAVTRGAPGKSAEIVDGLLSSHVRYQGFQGNIQATTKPVSFDQQAIADLMLLGSLTEWRAGGGIRVSESLGTRAVRVFYDPSESSFLPHLVARDSFLAGNDLLFLADIANPGDASAIEGIRQTIAFFVQKYQDEAVFAERVNQSVLRILRLKLRLYDGAFSSIRVLRSPESLATVGAGRQVSEQIAQKAATLISPSRSELSDRIPSPPHANEDVLIFTDVQYAGRCPLCAPDPIVAEDAFLRRVLALYGPGAAGQISSRQLTAFSMADLRYMLTSLLPDASGIVLHGPEEVSSAIASAEWIIFLTVQESPTVYGSTAVSDLVNLRPDLISGKKVIVFSLGVPYELDATDISKVDAYYALYDTSQSSLNMAARLLFQEMPADGASPVSVPSIGYILADVLAPNPNQTIDLSLVTDEGDIDPELGVVGFEVGDIIDLETAVIRDANGKPIADGTPVTFIFTQGVDGSQPLRIEVPSSNGRGVTSRVLDKVGLLTISATCGEARISNSIQLNIQEGTLAFPTVIPPLIPTSDTLPTPELTTPEVVNPQPAGFLSTAAVDLGLGEFLSSLLVILVIIGGQIRLQVRRRGDRLNLVRPSLIILIGGLAAYNYLAFGYPGSLWLVETFAEFAGILVTALGSLLTLGAWALYRHLKLRRKES